MNNNQENKQKRKNKTGEKLYKNRFHIVFYGEDDETYIAGFNTVVDICKYKNIEVTSQNIRYIDLLLYNALKRNDHSTRMLNGQVMYVYLIDMTIDE